MMQYIVTAIKECGAFAGYEPGEKVARIETFDGSEWAWIPAHHEGHIVQIGEVVVV